MHQVMNLRDRKHEHARSGISDLPAAQAAVADQAVPEPEIDPDLAVASLLLEEMADESN